MVEPGCPVPPLRRTSGRCRRLPQSLSRPFSRRPDGTEAEPRPAAAERRRPRVPGRQVGLRALGARRSGDGAACRTGSRRCRPRRASRGLRAIRGLGGPENHRRGAGDDGRRFHGRDLPARVEPGERPASSYPLRGLQLCADPRRRRVPRSSDVAAQVLAEGGRIGLPACAGLEPGRTARCRVRAVRPRRRLHTHRRDAPGPDSRLVETPEENDRGDGECRPADRRRLVAPDRAVRAGDPRRDERPASGTREPVSRVDARAGRPCRRSRPADRVAPRAGPLRAAARRGSAEARPPAREPCRGPGPVLVSVRGRGGVQRHGGPHGPARRNGLGGKGARPRRRGAHRQSRAVAGGPAPIWRIRGSMPAGTRPDPAMP